MCHQLCIRAKLGSNRRFVFECRNNQLAKIQEKIAEAFFEKLDDSEAVNKEMIDGLRALLSSDNKLKADEIAAVFTVDPTASDG